MKIRNRAFPSSETWLRGLTGLALVGACTVVDKGDYTFTDVPGEPGGDGGSTSGKGGSAGSSSGTAGKGGTSGDAGEGSGGTSGKGGSAGSAGTSGSGGEGGAGGPCDPNPCEHSGECTGSGTTFTCDCDGTGYEGDTCDEEIDECDPNPCLQMGMCTDLVADYSCACPAQVTGKNCELPRFQPIRGPGMSPMAKARSVSSDGSVVLGSFQDSLGFEKPFIWTFDPETGPMSTPLPPEPSLRPDVNVTPYALSGDGTAWVGEYRSTMGAPSPIGGNHTMTAAFAELPNTLGSAAFDVSGEGNRVVGYSTAMGAVGTSAVRWYDPRMPIVLPNPNASSFAAAGAITRDGTIIVGTSKDAMGNVFVVGWAEAGATPPGIRRTVMVTDLEVHGVSDDGMDAVGTYWDASGNHAFVTNSSSIVNIGPVSASGAASSSAWDISADGSVIVGEVSLGMTGAQGQAVVWKNDGSYEFRLVFDLLRDAGVMPMGWILLRAYGCSADGKTIVGEGTNPMGMTEGFIARLP